MGASQLVGSFTRNLAPFFREDKGAVASKCWLAFVGQGGGTEVYGHEVNEVKYTIQRGVRQMAKLVKRTDVVTRLLGQNQKNLGLGSFTEVSRAFPLSIEEYDIQASKETERLPIEVTENSGITKQQRMRYWAGEGQTTLMVKQANLCNLLAGQGILTGEQEAILGTSDADEKYDFYRNADHSETLATPWTTVATATPLDDLDEGIDKCIVNSGKVPKFALAGNDAIKAFLETDQIKNLADNRGFTAFRNFGPKGMSCPAEYSKLLANGWECRGSISTLKGRTLYLFGTEEMQANPAGGDDINCMPLGKVVLGNMSSRVDAQFGPGETFKEDANQIANYRDWFGFMPGVTPSGQPKITSGVIKPQMFQLDAYKNRQNTLITMRSQSAPLYIPVATDEWYVIENAA